jgi:pyrimidine-nucleoside phosphorylase
MYDILQKKRDGLKLSSDEVEDFVTAYVNGKIPDYVAAAFLMAVFTKGMDSEETFWLTQAMMNSGVVLAPGSMQGFKIDKHSTGGVGDKVTIVLAPLIAACGLKVPMISGRGLGHTGGTLDKLESIPGFKTELSPRDFAAQVNRIGAAIIGQSKEFVPADMKLYALRDVTGTVESIPLITSSILSKKLAEGLDGLVMDIKLGSGAFMKREEDALELAESIITTGRRMGKKVAALITDMSQPLGRTVGNAIEVKEAISGLRGEGPSDLMELVYALGERMLAMAGSTRSPSEARGVLLRSIESGRALDRFRDIVEAQHGDVRYVDHPELLEVSDKTWIAESPESGYVRAIDAYKIGSACVELGAGRERAGQEIDRRVGLVVDKKIGETVEEGEPLIEIMCDDASKARSVHDYLISAYEIGSQKERPPDLVHRTID